MTIRRTRKNSAGFTLIEILAAALLLSFALLSLAKLIVNASHAQSRRLLLFRTVSEQLLPQSVDDPRCHTEPIIAATRALRCKLLKKSEDDYHAALLEK